MEPAASAAAPAPSGGAPAPAPAAPAPAPAAPAAPTQTPEEIAAAADDQAWADAEKNTFGDQGGKPNEPAKSEKTPEEIAADEAAAANKTPNAQPGDGDEAAHEDAAKTAEAAANAAARDTRAANRAYATQVNNVKADVIAKMFADQPETLQDADGDPINSIEDVMKLVNPRTGEGFTEEEAATWFLAAQQNFNKTRQDMEKQAEQIAELNVDIKDQADAINEKYGEYLKANEQLRDELWAEWESTLTKDPTTGIITGMPMPLQKFYERALAPLVAAAPATPAPSAPPAAPGTPAAPEQTPEQKAAAEEQAKKDAKVAQQKHRSDRSDIYSPPADPKGEDPEDAEWAAAEKKVFGDQLNN